MTPQALLVLALASLLTAGVFFALWFRLFRRNRHTPVVPPHPTSTMQEKLFSPRPPADSSREPHG
ncbi:MAG: hypothetical protein ONB48_13345 [candidate division KSB1 bacterium]|nr:hypothetical protein [candidate division KSB1 bacterium]MDZ7274915.1 hypothetical protein [candidate division KSB1 bacterium]MDZ7286633.1 hypothetical protein [candidate division KSB1 bacterium]MDZ7299204.1 hypothetical protein [candidate division KSB1 bacterium]MDZ7309161.1 hypothetical protein [candidate division KSB1 bacterium]